MKPATATILTLAAVNSIWKGVVDFPKVEGGVREFLQETALDIGTFALVAAGTEWLATRDSIICKTLAWVPTGLSFSVMLMCVVIILIHLKKNKELKSRGSKVVRMENL